MTSDAGAYVFDERLFPSRIRFDPVIRPELMRVLSGSKWEVLRYLRWPTSLPYLFSALRIASTAALLGAVVAEWIGAQAGLGYLILATTYDFRTPLLYATMVVASAIALALFAAISILERSVVSWRQEEVRE